MHARARILAVALALAVLACPLAASAADPPAFSRADVGADTLVFQRDGVSAGSVEGFVIDTRVLVDTLKARVLEARGLGEVADVRPDPGQATRTDPAAYTYRHTFATPFDPVTATLVLAPLAEPDEGAVLQYLALFLAVCVAGGLLALYRMVETQILFAARQSDFVSAVSHELKTPLTAIRMHGEMLLEDLVDGEEKRREYYRTITTESERLSRLIGNVLELSSIERNDRRLAAIVGDVQDVVRDALDVLRPTAEERGFTLELVVDGVLPRVRYEPDAMRQIVFNLVDNAMKYAREASDKRVLVRCGRGPAGALVLAVRDFGPGASKETLKSMFSPFYRGEPELTRKHEGTGIGLALVRGLAEAMNGTASAANAGPGMLVTIEIPSGGRA